MSSEINTKEMNIYKKLSLITHELERVKKNLSVGTGTNKYKAVGEADVLSVIKPLEEKYQVYSYPISRVVIESKEIVKSTGTVSQFLRVETIYRFVNIDNPTEFIEITSYGDGVDTQDKAPGKAMTYADKYALLKSYKIETGEDPDKDPSGEFNKGEKNENGNTPPKKILATQEQVKQIKELFKEERLDGLLKHAQVEKLADLTIVQASNYIKLESSKQAKVQ